MYKYLLTAIICCTFMVRIHAQLSLTETVSSETWAVSFKIPAEWRYDHYGSSSVCDCPGVIMDNSDNDLKINVYYGDEASMYEENRLRVWDYVWDEAGALPFGYKTPSGVYFNGFVGQWKEKADGHKVFRVDAGMYGRMVRVYIFGPVPDYDQFKPYIEAFLDTFVFEKLKKKKRK